MQCILVCVLGILLLSAAAQEFSQDFVAFYLFNRYHPTEGPPISINSLAQSGFQFEKPTILTIHDYAEGASCRFNGFVVPALLTNQDANIITVDWSAGCRNYDQGFYYAKSAAYYISNFLSALNSQFGYNLYNVQLIGLGLGAHVAGLTGRYLQAQISHITGLDPVAYNWYENNDRLGKDCAQYVEVIHTEIGSFGYEFPLGHVDFYPNGGSNQPGCVEPGGCSRCESALTCSHQKSYEFLAQALAAEANGQQKYIGVQCNSYDEAVSQTCRSPGRAVFGKERLRDLYQYTGIYSFQTYDYPQTNYN